MIELPEIENNLETRPGVVRSGALHFIASPKKQKFWDELFISLNNSVIFSEPIENFSKKVNPYFGYFGFRWHPINFVPQYYHIGLDISETIGHPIKSVFDGFLEYSGFKNVNGNYLVIKHPEIKTKDGFQLQSLYMHCDRINLNFNVIQKVLREYFSKNLKISNKFIAGGQKIATVGSTGNKLGVVPHLHIQFEFVKNEKRVAVDPLKIFNKDSIENLTAPINSEAEFIAFYKKHSIALNPWKKFWPSNLNDK